FTGDLVNNLAEELEPWKSSFAKLNAKDGVFSVLGNHDYGDHVNWQTSNDWEDNHQKIKQTQAEMGWKLLCNETHFVEKNGERRPIVGAKYWGESGFKKAEDIDKPMNPVEASDYKIRVSNDLYVWKARVRDAKRNFLRTQSGHPP